MHRSEHDELDLCVDCGSELRASHDHGFWFGTTGVLCAACASRRGGRYDADRDAWVVVPDYGDLEAEFR
jgi:hypothetical protein